MQDSSSASKHPPEFPPSLLFCFFCFSCSCFLCWPLIERFPGIWRIWLVHVTKWFRVFLLLAMPPDYKTTLYYRSHYRQKIALFFWQLFPHRSVTGVAAFPVAVFLALLHPFLQLIPVPWKIIKSMDNIYEINDSWSFYNNFVVSM